MFFIEDCRRGARKLRKNTILQYEKKLEKGRLRGGSEELEERM
jgi:hypothetical protein